MPCAASPPSTFCQDQVTTSSLSQGSSIANTAEVASHSVSPSRSRGIQSPFGTRTPEVVPFHVKITSRSKSHAARDPAAPHTARRSRARRAELLASRRRPSPGRSSPTRARRPRAGRAATTSPSRSRPYPRPARCRGGNPRAVPSNALLRSITAFRRSLPIFARCERPSAASFSASRLQPGRLAQGPEENSGRSGRRVGFIRGAGSCWLRRRQGRGRRWRLRRESRETQPSSPTSAPRGWSRPADRLHDRLEKLR